MKRYDYIVVGAGSAGCAVAARLSEERDVSVLLVEAGRRDRHPFLRMPIAWLVMAGHPGYTWAYRSEPDPGLHGRSLLIPRGKTLGGSSTTNGMLYVRGHPRDYDRWAEAGCEGWSYLDVLPYFKRLETHWRGATEYHGADGPVQVSLVDAAEMLYEPLEAAALAAGHGRAPDQAGPTPEGVGRVELTTGNGERSSTARAYLSDAIRRPNLEVRSGAHVLKLMLEGMRATGLLCRDGNETFELRADREVVLCGGTYNTPQLLMLSGIGPADHLRDVGVEPVLDRPQVGENLCEHPLVQMDWQAASDNTFLKYLRLDRATLATARWLAFKTGPFVNNGAGTNIFMRTADGLDRPDIQLTCSAVGVNGKLWSPFTRNPPPHKFSCGVSLIHQRSRGKVRLRSADPTDAPRIFLNLMSDGADVDTMVRGIRAAREIYALEPQRSLLTTELRPGPKYCSDAELADWVRRKAAVTQHPTSTCRMGSDDDAVVDPQLRVRGIGSLRIADASIMPEVPGGNTNVPSIMVGEKAADLLRGRSLPRAVLS